MPAPRLSLRAVLTAAALTAWLGSASTAAAQVPPSPAPVPPVALPLNLAPALNLTPSGTRGRIVRRARTQLGYVDHGNYCTRFGPCEVWCALFATWVWRGAGIPIASLPFTGSIYDWAASFTSVLSRKQTPQPGDAVLFGSGPSSVNSSLHVGIVESVYPQYIVTLEGDANHGVRRFVVPLRHPQSIGEPGPIYAFASPLPSSGLGRLAARAPRPRPRALTGAALKRAIANQDVKMAKLTPTDIRLRKTIKALRAFQHMPYRTGAATIGWYGVDPQGRPAVAVVDTGTPADAELAWRAFLARWHDSGAAYAVSFYTAQP